MENNPSRVLDADGLAAVAALAAWLKGRRAHLDGSARHLQRVLLSTSVLVLAAGVEDLASPIPVKVLASQVSYLGLASLSVLWLLFVIAFVRRRDPPFRRWPGCALWPVRMDPAQIDHVLTNLCLNARDAILLPASGEGVASTRSGSPGRVLLGTDRAGYREGDPDRPPEVPCGDWVVLSVSDNGCGMSEETLAHLFEPFFTTKGAGQGTGLGLATVHGIVHQNGGALSVQSNAGCGSTFRIHLPRQVDPEASLPETLPDGDVPEFASPTACGTVLLVEDFGSGQRAGDDVEA